jgi:Tfp pilus assembly protein PilF
MPTDPAFRADLASVLSATDPCRAEAEFEEGLESGDNAELRAAYARFLLTVRHEPVRAAREWERAAQRTTFTSQRATFLLAAARASEAAGTTQTTMFYAAAVDADRTPTTLSAHASFLRHVLKDYRNAEFAYSGALELDPRNSEALLGYATFLEHVRGQHDRAETMYLRAVKEPSDAQARHAYAKFLMKVRGDYEGARLVIGEAVSLDPARWPTWAKVLSWPTFATVRDCLRFDAAELLACTMLVLFDLWTKL